MPDSLLWDVGLQLHIGRLGSVFVEKNLRWTFAKALSGMNVSPFYIRCTVGKSEHTCS